MPNNKVRPIERRLFHFDVRYGPGSGAKADFDVRPGWVKTRKTQPEQI
jgi:hypothetical protein